MGEARGGLIAGGRLPDVQNAALDRVRHRLCAVLRPEFFQDNMHVILDRVFRQIEQRGDLLVTLIATEGVASAEQRKWRANLVGNYTFARESFLKGWNIGTGVRWQDKVGTGYPVSLNADGSVKIDKSNPYFSQPETNVDGFLGYTRKIWKNRIEWKVQLNVRNLIGQTGVIPITVQPTGEAAVVRLAPEKRWYLTNTFSF